MARRDEYGCQSTDEACIIQSFPERVAAAERALRRNRAEIELTRQGTPSGRPTKWRRMDPPSRHDR